MLRSVFLGSPAFAATILARLCESNYRPSLVVTQPPKPKGRGQQVIPTAVETWAREHDLPVMAVADVNTPEALERIKATQPQILLVAAFGQILKEPLLQMPELFCLNVHGSLLPKYRGAAPVQRALWNGDKETGITIQRMERRLDTGDILVQRVTAIDEEDTSETLLNRLADDGGVALLDALWRVESGRYTFVPQDFTKATYAAKLDKSDAVLDFHAPAEEVRNRIRALNPWPVAETRFGNDRLKIFLSMSETIAYPHDPGTIVTTPSTVSVVCGDNRAIRLLELQLENRKRVTGREFLQGFRGQLPFPKLGAL